MGRSEDAGFLTSPVCSLPPLFSPLCRENDNTCVKIACCFLVSFSNSEETVFLFPSCPSLSLRLLAPLFFPPLPLHHAEAFLALIQPGFPGRIKGGWLHWEAESRVQLLTEAAAKSIPWCPVCILYPNIKDACPVGITELPTYQNYSEVSESEDATFHL